MQTPLTLGQKIRYARRNIGMSQKQLGEMLKLSDKAVSSYEVDRAVPPLETLKAISRATARPLTYFIAEMTAGPQTIEDKIALIEQELREIRGLLEKMSGVRE
jgi:transcriptional regulator with XRE-family HTH domain